MLPKENRYDFKKDLMQVHKKDRRDFALTPRDDEYVITDGIARMNMAGGNNA